MWIIIRYRYATDLLNFIIGMGYRMIDDQKADMRKLREQTVTDFKVAKKLKSTKDNAKEVNRIISVVTWRVKAYILALYAIAFILFIIIICILILKIQNIYL